LQHLPFIPDEDDLRPAKILVYQFATVLRDYF